MGVHVTVIIKENLRWRIVAPMGWKWDLRGTWVLMDA